MSLSEDVAPCSRLTPTDPNAARLLEMFTKADEILSERSSRGDRGSRNASRPSALGAAVVTSPLHSSYERGCQEKRLLPAPGRDAGVVTYIQPVSFSQG